MNTLLPLRAKSSGELLDSAFRVYRSNLNVLFRQLLPVLGFISLIIALQQFGEEGHVDWERISPLRASAVVESIVALMNNLAESHVLLGGVYYLLIFVLLVTVLLPIVNRAVTPQLGLFQNVRQPIVHTGVMTGALLLLPVCLLSTLTADFLISIVVDIWFTLREQAWPLLPGLLRLQLMDHSRALVAGLLAVAATAPLQLAVPVVLNEQLGVMASVRRSLALSQRGRWSMLWLAVLVCMLSALVMALPAMTSAIIRMHAVELPIVLNGAVLLRQVAEALVLPFQLAVIMVLYYDRRVRVEGYDITVRTAQAATVSATARYQQAVTLLQNEQYQEAVDKLDEAIVYQPTEPYLLYLRARTLNYLGQPERALADAQRACELLPGVSEYLFERGRLRGHSGDEAGAYVDMLESLTVNPHNVDVLDYLATLRHAQGDLSGALASLSKIITLAPNHDRAWYNSACIYALQSQPNAALDHLQRAIDINAAWTTTAATDADFNSLRDVARFQALLGTRPGPDM